MSSSLALYLVFWDMVFHWTQSSPTLLGWPSSKLCYSTCLHHPLTHTQRWLQMCVNAPNFYMRSWDPKSGAPAYTAKLHGLSHLPRPQNCFKVSITKWKMLPFSYNVVQLPYLCNFKNISIESLHKETVAIKQLLYPFSPVFSNLQAPLFLPGFIHSEQFI